MTSLAKAHYKSPSPPPSVSSASSSSSDSTSSSSSPASSSSDDDHDLEHLTVDDEDDAIDNEQGPTQSPVSNEQGLTPRTESVVVPGLDEREYVEECKHGGVVYHVGDVVHLMPLR